MELFRTFGLCNIDSRKPINVGLFCMGPAGSLMRSLDRKRTLELIMTGGIIDANRALEIGLINKIVPEADLAEETKKYAKKLAEKNPMAMQLGEKSLYQVEDMNFNPGGSKNVFR